MPKDGTQSEHRKEIERLLLGLPHHSFEIQESKLSDAIFLKSPWDDDALALIAHKDGNIKQSLFEALKKITFPREFSAIYHLEKKRNLKLSGRLTNFPKRIKILKRENLNLN